jgi:hypothetical protein
VNVSSSGAKIAIPLIGAYSLSKCGLEGMSDAAARTDVIWHRQSAALRDAYRRACFKKGDCKHTWSKKKFCYAFASARFEAEFFKSFPTVSSISRESDSSDTARASDIAPTSALKIKTALDLAVRLSLPGSNVAIN